MLSGYIFYTIWWFIFSDVLDGARYNNEKSLDEGAEASICSVAALAITLSVCSLVNGFLFSFPHNWSVLI